jgi:hypothetical protein
MGPSPPSALAVWFSGRANGGEPLVCLISCTVQVAQYAEEVQDRTFAGEEHAWTKK